MAGHKVLNKFINGAHGQGGHRVFKAQHIGDVGACQGKGLLFGAAKADARHIAVAPGNEGQQHGPAVHVEEHPVDGLDLNGRRMDIAHLGQTPAGGVSLPLLGRQGGFQLFPVSLGGGQRVVAVAHSQRQGFGPPGLRVLGVKGLLAAQALQGRGDPGPQCGRRPASARPRTPCAARSCGHRWAQ